MALLQQLSAADSYDVAMREAAALHAAAVTLRALPDAQCQSVMFGDGMWHALCAATAQCLKLFMQLWAQQGGSQPVPDEGGPACSLYAPLATLLSTMHNIVPRLVHPDIVPARVQAVVASGARGGPQHAAAHSTPPAQGRPAAPCLTCTPLAAAAAARRPPD